MAVQVPDRRGQPRSSSRQRPSVLGDGMVERARRAYLALLGMSTVFGLGLIAFMASQGWPLLPGMPIPSFPIGRGAVHDAAIVAQAPAQAGESLAAPARGPTAPTPQPHKGRSSHASATGGTAAADGSSSQLHVGGGHQIASSGTAGVTRHGRHPSEHEEAASAPAAPAPAQSSNPLPVQAPPAAPIVEVPPSHPGNGGWRGSHGNGKGGPPAFVTAAAEQAETAADEATSATREPVSPEASQGGSVALRGGGHAYGLRAAAGKGHSGE